MFAKGNIDVPPSLQRCEEFFKIFRIAGNSCYVDVW